MAANNMLNLGFSPLPVSQGGSGINTATAYGLMAAGTTATGAMQCISPGTAGQVFISGGASSLGSFQTMAGGISWSGVSGTTQAASINSGYIIQNASLTTVTLPATAAVGSIVNVQGLGAGGWVLAANTGQTIKLGLLTTTSAGSLASVNQWDCVQVVCIVANTTWAVCYTLSAGLTVV